MKRSITFVFDNGVKTTIDRAIVNFHEPITSLSRDQLQRILRTLNELDKEKLLERGDLMNCGHSVDEYLNVVEKNGTLQYWCVKCNTHEDVIL